MNGSRNTPSLPSKASFSIRWIARRVSSNSSSAPIRTTLLCCARPAAVRGVAFDGQPGGIDGLELSYSFRGGSGKNAEGCARARTRTDRRRTVGRAFQPILRAPWTRGDGFQACWRSARLSAWARGLRRHHDRRLRGTRGGGRRGRRRRVQLALDGGLDALQEHPVPGDADELEAALDHDRGAELELVLRQQRSTLLGT